MKLTDQEAEWIREAHDALSNIAMKAILSGRTSKEDMEKTLDDIAKLASKTWGNLPA